MSALNALTVPFQWTAAIRRGRVFHPHGVLTTGSIERIAPAGEGLPVETASEVLARLSKGLGTPGAVPDIIGLALRLPPGPLAATPWDILLASAGTGALGRVVGIQPVLRWSGQAMSSVMPLRYRGADWWLSARIVSDVKGIGVSLDDMRNQLCTAALELDLDQACGAGQFRRLARLTVTGVVPSGEAHDVAFDPVLHVAQGVEPRPRWLANVRAHAYDRSRHGRHAG
ncbi:phosphodiesterase [Mycobacterium sp. 21AC1]|uniref:phosphodiesterase n=1 Tax=[Mycobacterium] appelbergii TaxID=2939269 RepID=UPI0029394EA9|nr:phosphodiesterase [Mycobacterium sp. 21AC1]MDV3126942.1 phosphodiesterase [Mycobacterium sp. 21AC1]